MTQISRPFQIVLAAFVLVVGVWFVALRGHSSSATSDAPSAPAVVASSAAPTTSAPSNGALKHTIEKARGAVHHPQHSHAAAAKSSTKASTTPKATPKSAKSSKSAAASKPSTTATTKPATAPATASSASASANTQTAVEAELKQGKVVAVLFWNQKGTVDGVVRRELQAVSRSSHGGVVVHVAQANEIGAFGSFTRTVQVYSTPTILLINKSGKTSSLTGLNDAFGIEQAVREVKRAK